jgi:serine phosphatase RsbU (regulator of sigma subunit)
MRSASNCPPFWNSFDPVRIEVLETLARQTAVSIDNARYSSARLQLRPGDLVCFYTDGITEARNWSDEEFGRERLIGMLKGFRDRPAKEILRRLNREIQRFTRGSRQHDDITAFLISVDR